MLRTRRLYFFVTLFLIINMACLCSTSGLATPTADPNLGSVDSLNTAIVETVAALTLNAPTVTASFTPVPTETFTATPTLTPTETASATPEFTATLSVTLITVSVDTNCRSGPGKVYPREGSLLVGEVAEVLGVDPTNQYWYIRNPDAGNAADYCWVWDEYATLTGPTGQLPVYTPPPTPTPTLTLVPTNTVPPPPTFNAGYVSLDNCGGQWWVNIKLKNTSAVSFKSVYVSVKDKATSDTQVQLKDEFMNKSGCAEKNSKDVLGSGDTYIISSPPFGYDLKAHELKITITLCSETGLKGLCSTRGVGVIP